MDTKIYPANPATVAELAEKLKAGELVAMPTETVYGLAANAFDESAVLKIFHAKERPLFDPLICHVALPNAKTTVDQEFIDSLQVHGLVDWSGVPIALKNKIFALLKKYWPGPLTVTLPRGSRVPDLVTAGLPNVGIRMPRHLVAQQLIRAAGVPLAAPSANRFGRISPTSADAVSHELQGRIAAILDGGECQVGVESTVIGLQGHEFVLYRLGGLDRAEVEKILGPVKSVQNVVEGQALHAPGTTKSHYAPRKKLFLLQTTALERMQFGGKDPLNLDVVIRQGLLSDGGFVGVMVFQVLSDETDFTLRLQKIYPRYNFIVRSLCSDKYNIELAARRLFQTMRELDGSNAQVLVAEKPFDEKGLGGAVLDRLTRAAS